MPKALEVVVTESDICLGISGALESCLKNPAKSGEEYSLLNYVSNYLKNNGVVSGGDLHGKLKPYVFTWFVTSKANGAEEKLWGWWRQKGLPYSIVTGFGLAIMILAQGYDMKAIGGLVAVGCARSIIKGLRAQMHAIHDFNVYLEMFRKEYDKLSEEQFSVLVSEAVKPVLPLLQEQKYI